jgi:hypothetical protein
LLDLEYSRSLLDFSEDEAAIVLLVYELNLEFELLSHRSTDRVSSDGLGGGLAY